jgi:CRISPR-associated protein Cas2
MYIILVYDIKERRVGKALKISRKYLTWIQNSVFEGELTIASFEKLKIELSKAINKDEDSIVIFLMRTDRYTERIIIGQEKGNKNDNFL